MRFNREVNNVCLCVMLLFIALQVSAASRARNSSQTQQTMSIEQLDSALTAVQQSSAEFKEKLDQLLRDSSSISIESEKTLSRDTSVIDSLDSRIGQFDQNLSNIRSKRDKARQDSTDAATVFSQQYRAAQKEAAEVDSTLTRTAKDLETLKSKRNQISKIQVTKAGKALIQLKSQQTFNDSLARAKQQIILELTKSLEQLRKDSVTEESKRNATMISFRKEIRGTDSLLRLINSDIEELKARQKQQQQNNSVSLATEKEKLATLNAEVARVSASYGKMKMEIGMLESEKARLKQSAGTAIQKYEQQRAPLKESLDQCDYGIKKNTADREIFLKLRARLKLDSAIAKVRDDLDKEVAKNSPRKVVTQKENELDELMKQQDQYKRDYDVAGKNASMMGLTFTQKKVQVEKMISAATEALNDFSTRKMKAEQALSVLERNNPASNNPTVKRLAQIDTILVQKNRELKLIADKKDSLSVTVSQQQTAVNNYGTNTRLSSDSLNNILSGLQQKSTGASAQHQQLVIDSLTQFKTASVDLNRIIKEITASVTKVNTLQQELYNLSTQQTGIKTSIQQTAEQDRSEHASLQSQAGSLDSTIAERQKQISSLSSQSASLNQKKDGLKQQYESRKQSIVRTLFQADSIVGNRNKERSAIVQQRDAVFKTRDKNRQTSSGQLIRIHGQIVSVRKQIEAQQSRYDALSASRQSEVQEMKGERASIDNRIATAQQQISSLESSKVAAVQDSTAVQQKNRETLVSVKSQIQGADRDAASSRQQLVSLESQVEKARQDSTSALAARNAALQPFRRSIRQIDSIIEIKQQEIASLRGQRQQVVQDSIAERRKQNDLIEGVKSEIVFRLNQVREANAELTKKVAYHKKLQQDSISLATGAGSQQSSQQIQRIQSQIEQQRQTIASLQIKKQELDARIIAAEGRGRANQYISGSVVRNVPPAFSSKEGAQKYVEQIYTLISENQNAKALQLFNSQREPLRKFLEPEAYQVLQNSFAQ